MKIVLLSLVLWAGISYGSLVMPYPFNYIVSADLMHPPPMYDYPFPSPQVLKKLPPIKEKHMNQSLAFASTVMDKLRRLESSLDSAGIVVHPGSPEHGLAIHGRSNEDAMTLDKLSSTVTIASKYMANVYCGNYGVPDDECASYISTFSLQRSPLGAACARLHQQQCSASRLEGKYRSWDGSCNNPRRGSWGQALTGFKRLLHPRYGDGIQEPRRSSLNKVLPAARNISATLSWELMAASSQHSSLALMQWTQFLEHDLIHVPMRSMVYSPRSISCCEEEGGPLSPRHQHPSCLPLGVERTDPFYGARWVSCLPYVRSATTFRSDCTFGAAEQMNQASHFLDGSQIYGSSAQTGMSLRRKEGGQLREHQLAHGAFLPLAESPRGHCQVNSDDAICYKAGDGRANMHPHLAAMHTVWLREHNRVARALAELNPSWGDEQLYQEARRILVAQLQHITYSHWLPKVTGKPHDPEMPELSDSVYNPETDPTISNAVATAGLRFFTSLMSGTLHLLDEDRSIRGLLHIKRHFNKPAVLAEEGKLEQLFRGLPGQKGSMMDLQLTKHLTQHLFSSGGNASYGLDMLAMDIQRGRDHGLPPYHEYRSLCGLPAVSQFEDFSDVMSAEAIQQLKRVYKSAHDVDLIVGAFAENPRFGAVVGPTLSCLIEEQLNRTRSADRFFYTNPEQPAPFTQQQIAQIRKASLSRVICDNVPQIKSVQRDVFSVASTENPLVSCDGLEIKRVNLVAWQDPSNKPHLLTRTKRNVNKWIKA